MRLRTLIGFGIGYVLGARSDTQRYDNLQDLYQSVTQSPIFKALLQQARQTAASGVQSLTGQEPTWAGGNGGQARQQGGQAQQQSQQATQGQQSEESQSGQSEESESSGKSQGKSQGKEQSKGNGGKGEEQKQQSGQSSS